MPASSAILARWRAASRVEAATLVRLDPGKTANPEIPQPNYVAGFGSASLPEAMAPDLLTALVRWLRSTEGFNDRVVKRCARAHMVGILLVQRPPVGSTKAIEMAIDFACNSVTIAGDLGRGRVVLSSFFDSSRAELLSILKRAIPLDHELGDLR